MVKSDTASFSIPELEFEVPANTQRGGSIRNVMCDKFVYINYTRGINLVVYNMLYSKCNLICKNRHDSAFWKLI